MRQGFIQKYWCLIDWIKDLDYVNIHSVNPLYLIIDKVDGYIEENNQIKNQGLLFTDKNKDIFKKVYKTMGLN